MRKRMSRAFRWWIWYSALPMHLEILKLQQVAEIVETLSLLGALLSDLISRTLRRPSPLINVSSNTKLCWKPEHSTLKGGEGGGRWERFKLSIRWVLKASKGVFLTGVSHQFCNLLYQQVKSWRKAKQHGNLYSRVFYLPPQRERG